MAVPPLFNQPMQRTVAADVLHLQASRREGRRFPVPLAHILGRLDTFGRIDTSGQSGGGLSIAAYEAGFAVLHQFVAVAEHVLGGAGVGGRLVLGAAPMGPVPANGVEPQCPERL